MISASSTGSSSYVLIYLSVVIALAAGIGGAFWLSERRSARAFGRQLHTWDLPERQARRWALLDLLYRATGGRPKPFGFSKVAKQLGWSPRVLNHFVNELVAVGLLERGEAPWLNGLRTVLHGKAEAEQRSVWFEHLGLSTQGILAWEHCSRSELPSECLAREMRQRGAEIDLDLRGSRDSMVHLGDGQQVRVDRSPGAIVTVSDETFDSDLAAALAAVSVALAQVNSLSADQAARAAGWLELAEAQQPEPDNERLHKALSVLHTVAVGAAGEALWDSAKLALAVALAHFPT